MFFYGNGIGVNSFLGVRRTELSSKVNVKSVRNKMEIRIAVRLRNPLRCVISGLFQNTVLFILI